MFKPSRLSLVVAIGAAFAAWSPQPAAADDSETFYAGKTIRIIVPAGAGGAFDLYSRLLSRHLPKYLPGNPNIILQYMPGAGGTKATNYMANVAPKDGTAISMPLAPIALAQAIGGSSIKYNATKFGWIGRMADINRVLAVWHTSPIKAVKDVFDREVPVASTGRDSETYMNAAVMNNVMGAKFKIITGYKGVADMALAMQRGEVTGFFGSWGAWYASHQKQIAEKEINFLVQIGTKRVKALADVPLMVELAKTDSDRQVIEFMSRTSDLGHSIYVPADVPSNRVAALRKAFDEALKDPALLEEAKRMRLEINPEAAKYIMASVDATVNAPRAVIDRFTIAIGGK